MANGGEVGKPSRRREWPASLCQVFKNLARLGFEAWWNALYQDALYTRREIPNWDDAEGRDINAVTCRQLNFWRKQCNNRALLGVPAFYNFVYRDAPSFRPCCAVDEVRFHSRNRMLGQ
jgi:hypothetical protein